ncbi:MAG TPA: hypothetical protein VM617_00560 [Thermoanaerobaculia bacterium]|nr:hypothetical protein [Thermoanaerobaculia bacterium]
MSVRHPRLLGAVLAGALALSPATGAAEPVVAVELPAGELAVGDHAAVTLVVDVGDAVLDAAPRFPAWRDAWGSAEVVQADEPVRSVEDGRVLYRQRVVLQVFRPGEVALPPLEVAVPLAGGTRTISTPADLALTIGSVLPPGAGEGEDEAIPPPQPPAPPRALPLGAAFWVTSAVGTALLLALLLPMLRRRHAAAAGRRPALEPLPELTAALAAARSADSAQEGHALVSLALRRYLGRRLTFPAAESTTSEVQRQLLARHLPAGLPKRAVELLRACDLVKFARRPAARSEVERWAGEAGQVAAAVEAHLVPPEAAEPREAAA